MTWAFDRSDLTEHRLRGIKSLHHSGQAEIIWLDNEIGKFIERTPEHVARIIIAVAETGLRLGDLHRTRALQRP
ncbi:hypothetical protein [Mangrovicoccus ximenensis]|uniref:hypothetical protein n=1 Tax=Mangrovicoccus ximenensis TaxID=1911570 RepID=UPI000D3D20BF|nr:hypothetical protein [Mangrovicoccus ximenensis]